MEIQERIITEAGQLFARYGIRSVTMDTLAENMGISKRTIYEKFKDKDELLLEVITYYKSAQLREANQIIEKSENVIVAFYQLLNGMINTMRRLNPLFFQDMKKYHSHLFIQLQERGDIRDHSITDKMLREGLKQGIFRNDTNLEIVNQVIHELFQLFGPDSKLSEEGYNHGELFNNIIIPYLIGISTEYGRSLIEKQGPFNY